MKKIMFNDKYGLTQAVIEERKPMTRREVKGLARGVKDLRINNGICEMLYEGATMWVTCNVQPKYKLGEVVAVAQSYSDIKKYNPDTYEDVMLSDGVICEASHPYSHLMRSEGWNNKMFVEAELMPTRIRITDIKAERLQDISDEDCLKEGVIVTTDGFTGEIVYTFHGSKINYMFATTAFEALIDKVSGNGTWESNPFVFAYTYEVENHK